MNASNLENSQFLVGWYWYSVNLYFYFHYSKMYFFHYWYTNMTLYIHSELKFGKKLSRRNLQGYKENKDRTENTLYN